MEQNKNSEPDLPVTIKGKVIQGKGLGKKFGVATANLEFKEIAKELNKFPLGVYAAKVRIITNNQDNNPKEIKFEYKFLPAAVHYGPRMILNEQELQFEVHILDFDEDVYGKELEVTLLRYLRTSRKFNSKEDMITQLHIDIEQTRVVVDKNTQK